MVYISFFFLFSFNSICLWCKYIFIKSVLTLLNGFVLYDSHNALVLSPKKVSKYLYIVSGSVSWGIFSRRILLLDISLHLLHYSIIVDREMLYLVFGLRHDLGTYRVFLLGRVFL